MSWSSDFRSIIFEGTGFFFFFFFFFNIKKKFVFGSRKCLIQGAGFLEIFLHNVLHCKADVVGRIFFSISQHIKVSGVTLDEYILPYHFIIIIPNWFTKISWSKQPWVLDFSNLNVANYVKRFEQVIQYNLINWYRIIAFYGACAYSRKNAFWELIENVGAPILYILRLTSVRLYASRGECT